MQRTRRTQHGNNNAYCQDNALSWFDWTLLERHRDIHRFVRQLIADRLWLSVRREDPSVSLTELLRRAEIQAHGVTLGCPDWSPTSHSLAFTVRVPRRGLQVHLMLNAYWEPLAFELPPVREGRHDRWRRWLDTSLASPQDICAAVDAPVVPDAVYLVQPRSLAVLWTRLHAEASGGLRQSV
jgi:isoamylase